MNRYCAAAFSLLLVSPLSAQYAAEEGGYPIEDHLVPVHFEADKEFRAKIQRRLLVHTESCARVLYQPSSDPETGVSVYRNKVSSGFQVKYSKAERNMWYAQSASNPNRSTKPVNVTQTSAPIPESTAQSIFKAWKLMLSKTRDYDEKRYFRLPVGGSVSEFSLIEPHARTLYGETPLFGRTGKEQPKTLALVRIGQKLGKYCEATPNRQPGLAKQIEADANRLVNELQMKSKR